MNALLKITNALLAIIAVCLCLLVLKVYDVSVVPEAHAQQLAGTIDVRVVNDSLPCTVKGMVSIGTDHGYGLQPVRGVNGALAVAVQEP